jgi:hypothetical protein
MNKSQRSIKREKRGSPQQPKLSTINKPTNSLHQSETSIVFKEKWRWPMINGPSYYYNPALVITHPIRGTDIK